MIDWQASNNRSAHLSERAHGVCVWVCQNISQAERAFTRRSNIDYSLLAPDQQNDASVCPSGLNSAYSQPNQHE